MCIIYYIIYYIVIYYIHRYIYSQITYIAYNTLYVSSPLCHEEGIMLSFSQQLYLDIGS